MKTLLIILLLTNSFKGMKAGEFKISDLGYKLNMPNGYSVSTLKGGTYVWVEVNGLTRGGIQRWPTSFSYDDFIYEIKNFSNTYKSELVSGSKPDELHHVINDSKDNYFKYIVTEYYNFYIWSNSPEILKEIENGLELDFENLKMQYSKGIDYPIEGDSTICFLNNQQAIKRSDLNIFEMKIDTSYYIFPYLMISKGVIRQRYKNIYSITEIPENIDNVKISINASDKTGTDQLNFRKDFEVVE